MIKNKVIAGIIFLWGLFIAYSIWVDDVYVQLPTAIIAVNLFFMTLIVLSSVVIGILPRFRESRLRTIGSVPGRTLRGRGRTVDFGHIWRSQALPPGMRAQLVALAKATMARRSKKFTMKGMGLVASLY